MTRVLKRDASLVGKFLLRESGVLAGGDTVDRARGVLLGDEIETLDAGLMKIFTEFDGSEYRLMCDDGRMSATPCVARLFRAPPWPEIQFAHDNPESAEADARKLRAYLAALTPVKASKKRTRESAA